MALLSEQQTTRVWVYTDRVKGSEPRTRTEHYYDVTNSVPGRRPACVEDLACIRDPASVAVLLTYRAALECCYLFNYLIGMGRSKRGQYTTTKRIFLYM